MISKHCFIYRSEITLETHSAEPAGLGEASCCLRDKVFSKMCTKMSFSFPLSLSTVRVYKVIVYYVFNDNILSRDQRFAGSK